MVCRVDHKSRLAHPDTLEDIEHTAEHFTASVQETTENVPVLG